MSLLPPALPDDWCYSHHRSEPDEGAYRVCGECCHVWITQEDLMADVIKMSEEIGSTAWPIGPQFVYFCPLCGHDF